MIFGILPGMFVKKNMVTKRLPLVVLLFCGLFLTGFVSKPRSFRGIPCATPLATHKGIPARSNQSYPYGSCDGTSVYGLQYQCVEYVRRFYHLVKGIETREKNWRGDASTFFQTADSKGLKRFGNGGSVPPLPDDIITFKGGLYGHVAVITAVTDKYIEFIEQNLSQSGMGRLAYDPKTHQVADRELRGGRLILEGWLRPNSG